MITAAFIEFAGLGLSPLEHAIDQAIDATLDGREPDLWLTVTVRQTTAKQPNPGVLVVVASELRLVIVDVEARSIATLATRLEGGVYSERKGPTLVYEHDALHGEFEHTPRTERELGQLAAVRALLGAWSTTSRTA